MQRVIPKGERVKPALVHATSRAVRRELGNAYLLFVAA